jgi:transcriptional regulator of acetoin/glycerol metabolism
VTLAGQPARAVVRCLHCELRQFAAASCRRCHRSLLAPAVTSERSVALATSPLPWPESKPLPTMREVRDRLIAAAIDRTDGDPMEAAKLIGIGKTTIYRLQRAGGRA